MIASTKGRTGVDILESHVNPHVKPCVESRKPTVGLTLTSDIAVQRVVQLLHEAVAQGALPAL